MKKAYGMIQKSLENVKKRKLKGSLKELVGSADDSDGSLSIGEKSPETEYEKSHSPSTQIMEQDGIIISVKRKPRSPNKSPNKSPRRH